MCRSKEVGHRPAIVYIPGSSNGRTGDFESPYLGSNPSPGLCSVSNCLAACYPLRDMGKKDEDNDRAL